MCDPRKKSDDNAKRYTTCEEDTGCMGRAGLMTVADYDFIGFICCVRVIYSGAFRRFLPGDHRAWNGIRRRMYILLCLAVAHRCGLATKVKYFRSANHIVKKSAGHAFEGVHSVVFACSASSAGGDSRSVLRGFQQLPFTLYVLLGKHI